MRYLFIGLLLAGFSSMQAMAESETSADPVFESLCEDSGHQKGSDEFDRCLENYWKNGVAHESENGSVTPEENPQQPSGIAGYSAVADEKNADGGAANAVPAARLENSKKAADESFCENFGYAKGTADYELCLTTAAENGYAGDASKMQNGQQNGGRKKKRRL